MVVGESEARVWGLIAASASSRGGLMSLRDLCVVCARILAADGVGVSLLNGDRLEPVYAEGGLSRELLEAELTSGDGPCVEAMRTGRPVLADDLGTEGCGRRWPLFSATAQASGVAAAFAFPLMTGVTRIGVLVACRNRAGELGDAAYRDALVLADTTVTLLLQDQEAAVGDAGGGRYSGEGGGGNDSGVLPAEWLALGAEIHQATGMVSVQLDCTVDQALVRLRAYAFAHDVPITQVARRVVERTLRFSTDNTRP
ncbi:GAF and ANTAR domain-containing protein [Actinomadura kijaniata]|uniref:GAF and ANTAR domain-containing protein n=1 Tax=Actinomadura kijaniata TaxID=46161 RepID=UPI003F1C332E